MVSDSSIDIDSPDSLVPGNIDIDIKQLTTSSSYGIRNGLAFVLLWAGVAGFVAGFVTGSTGLDL